MTHVTIAGGGLAGLSAALRLAERGYRVKLYESKDVLGGNVASRHVGERVWLDVYPHMYLNWYHNFWALLADVTDKKREQLFRPMEGVQWLRAGTYPHFRGLKNPYRPRNLLRNLIDGPAPAADLYLFLYASIDLMAERLNPTLRLGDVSVNGFLRARPYMTERTAEFFDDLIVDIWGIPSYLAAADDYQEFLEYSVADPSPPFWLARGSGHDQVLAPLEAKLRALGVEIELATHLVSASCAKGRVTEIGVRDADGETRTEDVDELLLALPPAALSRIVRRGESPIVKASPQIAEVARLSAQPVPLIHVYFKRRLQVPAEPTALSGSSLGLAFTDISQTWDHVPDFAGAGTVLALSSSDPFGLPGTGAQDDAMAILRQAADYLEFELGDAWGDSRDIDWAKTTYAANADTTLFVNETGTDVWRPKAADPRLPNLSYAGDYCDNRIGMTTIESAVTSGLDAAAAIVARRGGKPVEIREPRTLPQPLWLWLRVRVHAVRRRRQPVVTRERPGRGRVPPRRPSALRERPHLVDQREQRARRVGEPPRLLTGGVGDPVQHPLGFVELLAAAERQRRQPVGVVVVDQEQRARLRVTDRQRRRQGEDAVADVLLPSSAEGFEAALIADVVTAVVEDADQMPVVAEALRARAEHGADLEHRAGVLARDPPPVLDPQRLPAQPPLQALRGGEAAQQLGQVADRERVLGEGVERVGDEVPGAHQRVQRPEALLDGVDAAPLVGLVEHVVDDERHVVHELHRERQLDRVVARRALRGAMAGEQGERAIVLRRAREGPRQGLAQLLVDAVQPGRQPRP